MMQAQHSEIASQPPRWLVVNTHPHKEHVALQNLAQQNFAAYCPLVRKQIKHARRSQTVLRPLFPSYIFVRVDFGMQRWRPILSTIGVRTLVRFGEQLGSLDDRFLQGLKAREVDGAIVRPQRPYAIGQQVRMAGGAFDGLIATIVELDEKDRLIVLMDLLNRTVKVKTESNNVAAA
jgi:transcriptional antiterminator RfaH